jgi:hypothetical protein
MADIIGVIDLTVRHSSMNPLNIIDPHGASSEFEQMVLVACRDMLNRTVDADRARRMRDRGIVVEGPAAKFFQFEHAEDAMAFSRHVRSLLLERKLPFKLCLAKGSLGERSLRDRWKPVLDSAQGSGTDAENAKRELMAQFATTDGSEIEQLFQAYLAPGFHEDAISLALDLDAFKGFGMWIDPALGSEFPGTDLFRNHHPVAGRRRHDLAAAKEFIDCRFPRSDDDIIVRAAGADPDILPSGQTARIASVCDLLRRSMKAGDENGIHYVSLLVTMVRSSSFGAIAKLASDEATGDPNDDRTLLAGWQRHPPMFHTLLLDASMRTVLKRMPGIELVVAALLDEIHAAGLARVTGDEPRSSADLDVGTSGDLRQSFRDRHRVNLTAVAVDGGPFAEAVKTIESAFGENILRRVWTVPDAVLNPERKRAALDITVRR